MIKKSFFFLLLFLLIPISVNAAMVGPDDTLSIPFWNADSAGIKIDLVAGDSIYLVVFSPGNAVVFKDSMEANDASISYYDFEDWNKGRSYRYSELVSNLLGSATSRGIYTYDLTAHDIDLDLTTMFKGEFQYISHSLDSILAYLDATISSRGTSDFNNTTDKVTIADSSASDISLLVNAHPGVDILSISGDVTAANNLETMLDGTGTATLSLGRLVISGANSTNGSVKVTNTSGDGVIFESTGSNGTGLKLIGNGSGSGAIFTGGTTGNGILAVAGGTAAGFEAQGGTSTTGGVGIKALGGGTSSAGLWGQGGGSGSGIRSQGGATGHGIYALGGSSSGNGFYLSTTSGHGININPISGHGIYSVPSGDTYHGIFVDSIRGGFGVSVTTNNDKTGYSLTQTFPTNFSALAITGGGAVTAGTVSDKTGYSISGSKTTLDALNDIAAVDPWNISWTYGFTAGSMGDSLSTADYVRGSGVSIWSTVQRDSLLAAVADLSLESKVWTKPTTTRLLYGTKQTFDDLNDFNYTSQKVTIADTSAGDLSLLANNHPSVAVNGTVTLADNGLTAAKLATDAVNEIEAAVYANRADYQTDLSGVLAAIDTLGYSYTILPGCKSITTYNYDIDTISVYDPGSVLIRRLLLWHVGSLTLGVSPDSVTVEEGP